MRKLVVEVGAANTKINLGYDYILFEPRDKELDPYKDCSNVKNHNIGLYSEKTTKTLYVTQKGQCSSLYEPDMEELKKHDNNPKRFNVVKTVELDLVRLDSIIPSGTVIDYLKIDTQGSELDILKGAGELLRTTKMIECEVEFVPLYKQQPLFEDVERYLKIYGFKFQKYKRTVKWHSGTLVFGDAIFIKVDKNENRRIR